jgi:hypothetical protein
MLISAIALLLPAPLLATSPLQVQIAVSPLGSGATRAAHAANDQGQSSAGASLSVQKVCTSNAPAMFSGRARREKCELTVVQPRCKSSAPAMFSGRASRAGACVVEMTEPHVATSAPSIFSGRAPRPVSAYAPPAYSYVVAPDGTATPQVTYQTRQEAAKTYLPPRLPSMFTGRRPRPRPAAPAQ